MPSTLHRHQVNRPIRLAQAIHAYDSAHDRHAELSQQAPVVMGMKVRDRALTAAWRDLQVAERTLYAALETTGRAVVYMDHAYEIDRAKRSVRRTEVNVLDGRSLVSDFGAEGR